jgi:hypothetical protein
MASGPHRIRRQRWCFRTASTTVANEARRRVRADLESVYTPLIEQCFDAYARATNLGERVVRIPQLEVNLSVTNLDDLRTKLVAQLTEQLLRVAGPADAASLPDPFTHAIDRRLTLLQYLVTGSAAWTDAAEETSVIVARLRDEAIRWVGNPVSLWRALDADLPSGFAERVACCFRLVQLLPAAESKDLLRLAQTAFAQSDRAPLDPLLAALLADCVLSTFASDRYYRVHAAAVAMLTAPVLPPLAEALAHVPDTLAGQVLRTARTARVPETQPSTSRKSSPSRDRRLLHGEARARVALQSDEIRVSRLVDATASTDRDTARSRPTSQPVSAVSRVASAGLALLHPYLAPLFQATGVIDPATRLLLPEELPRAAALMHWLATGRDELFELELPGIKVLLGLRPDAPLPLAGGVLDAVDRAECLTLLQAVVRHWTALRGTSIDGLRVSFLQRQGVLSDEGSFWQLAVEREAFDVLLAHLPWSISIVKLPWMTHPIFVDWPSR